MISNRLRVLLCVGAGMFALAFAVFVWPTRWYYGSSNIYGRRVMVRVDRFTGRPYYLSADGWGAATGTRRMRNRGSRGSR